MSGRLPGSVPSHRIRATDDERRRTVERLCRAHGLGCLTMDELDERVSAAWAARTRGDLACLTEDLPPDRQRSQIPVCQISSHAHPVLRRLTSAWLMVSVVSIAAWGVLAAAFAGLADPWWIWVTGPSGAVLALSWLVSDHR